MLRYLLAFSAAAAATALLTAAARAALSTHVLEQIRGHRRHRGHRRGDGRRLALFVAVAFSASFAAAAGAFGRPILGLAVAFPLPFAARAVAGVVRSRRARALEVSALVTLHALRGLLAAGVSLPSALFLLARGVPSPFTDSLRRSLAGFAGGRPLARCLSRFRERAALGRAATLLAAMETAYAEGLPLLPLLEGQLPVLEAEARGEARLGELRRAVAVQIAVASALPWGLAGVLGAFDPATLDRFRGSPALFPVLAAAFALEGGGAWVLWRLSRFH